MAGSPTNAAGGSGGLSVRTLILALPTLYLLVALYLMDNRRAHLLPAVSTVPSRVLYMGGAQQALRAQMAPDLPPPVAAAEPAAAPKPRAAQEAPAPAPAAGGSSSALVAKYNVAPKLVPEDKARGRQAVLRSSGLCERNLLL